MGCVERLQNKFCCFHTADIRRAIIVLATRTRVSAVADHKDCCVGFIRVSTLGLMELLVKEKS
jgi:hypothetical protein